MMSTSVKTAQERNTVRVAMMLNAAMFVIDTIAGLMLTTEPLTV